MLQYLEHGSLLIELALLASSPCNFFSPLRSTDIFYSFWYHSTSEPDYLVWKLYASIEEHWQSQPAKAMHAVQKESILKKSKQPKWFWSPAPMHSGLQFFFYPLWPEFIVKEQFRKFSTDCILYYAPLFLSFVWGSGLFVFLFSQVSRRRMCALLWLSAGSTAIVIFILLAAAVSPNQAALGYCLYNGEITVSKKLRLLGYIPETFAFELKKNPISNYLKPIMRKQPEAGTLSKISAELPFYSKRHRNYALFLEGPANQRNLCAYLNRTNFYNEEGRVCAALENQKPILASYFNTVYWALFGYRSSLLERAADIGCAPYSKIDAMYNRYRWWQVHKISKTHPHLLKNVYTTINLKSPDQTNGEAQMSKLLTFLINPTYQPDASIKLAKTLKKQNQSALVDVAKVVGQQLGGGVFLAAPAFVLIAAISFIGSVVTTVLSKGTAHSILSQQSSAHLHLKKTLQKYLKKKKKIWDFFTWRIYRPHGGIGFLEHLGLEPTAPIKALKASWTSINPKRPLKFFQQLKASTHTRVPMIFVFLSSFLSLLSMPCKVVTIPFIAVSVLLLSHLVFHKLLNLKPHSRPVHGLKAQTQESESWFNIFYPRWWSAQKRPLEIFLCLITLLLIPASVYTLKTLSVAEQLTNGFNRWREDAAVIVILFIFFCFAFLSSCVYFCFSWIGKRWPTTHFFLMFFTYSLFIFTSIGSLMIHFSLLWPCRLMATTMLYFVFVSWQKHWKQPKKPFLHQENYVLLFYFLLAGGALMIAPFDNYLAAVLTFSPIVLVTNQKLFDLKRLAFYQAYTYKALPWALLKKQTNIFLFWAMTIPCVSVAVLGSLKLTPSNQGVVLFTLGIGLLQLYSFWVLESTWRATQVHRSLLTCFFLTALLVGHILELESTFKLVSEDFFISELLVPFWAWSHARTWIYFAQKGTAGANASAFLVILPNTFAVYFNYLHCQHIVHTNQLMIFLLLIESSRALLKIKKTRVSHVSYWGLATQSVKQLLTTVTVINFIFLMTMASFFLKASVPLCAYFSLLIMLNFAVGCLLLSALSSMARSDAIKDLRGALQPARFLARFFKFFFCLSVFLCFALACLPFFYSETKHSWFVLTLFFLFLVFLFLPNLKFWWALSSFFSHTVSEKVKAYRSYGEKACATTLGIFAAKHAAFINAMTPSGLKYYDKKMKWLRSIESMPQRVQRLERDTPRREYQLPFWSAGLHLEILNRVVKFMLLAFVLANFLYWNEKVDLTVETILAISCVLLVYFSVHLSVSKLVYRHKKFWWWWSWYAIFPIYAKGHVIFRTYYVVLFAYFHFNIYIILGCVLLQYLYPRFEQTFIWTYGNTWWELLAHKFMSYPKDLFARKYKKELKWWDKKSRRLNRQIKKPIKWFWKFTKKFFYIVWVCLTPFLDERRRLGLRFYWTWM